MRLELLYVHQKPFVPLVPFVPEEKVNETSMESAEPAAGQNAKTDLSALSGTGVDKTDTTRTKPENCSVHDGKGQRSNNISCLAGAGQTGQKGQAESSKLAIEPGADRISPDAHPFSDSAAEPRRQCVMAILRGQPHLQTAMLTDTEAERDAVIVTLALCGRATGELRIPRVNYRPLALMKLFHRHHGGPQGNRDTSALLDLHHTGRLPFLESASQQAAIQCPSSDAAGHADDQTTG